MKFLLPLSFLLLLTVSCESDADRIRDAKNVVSMFVSNTKFENEGEMFKLYPEFQSVRSYWKLNNFKLTNASIEKDHTVTVVGTANKMDLWFKLRKQDGKYIIKSSKGISSDFNTPLYHYVKKIGCISSGANDVEVSRACKDKQLEYEILVQSIKNRIENKVNLESNNLNNSWGYVSGNVTIRNESRFSVPSMAYKLEINFYDGSGNHLFTETDPFAVYSIPYGQSMTKMVHVQSSRRWQKVSASIKITDTGFIEQIIKENATGSNCKYSYNL